jgi:hypothetical protein
MVEDMRVHDSIFFVIRQKQQHLRDYSLFETAQEQKSTCKFAVLKNLSSALLCELMLMGALDGMSPPNVNDERLKLKGVSSYVCTAMYQASNELSPGNITLKSIGFKSKHT